MATKAASVPEPRAASRRGSGAAPLVLGLAGVAMLATVAFVVIPAMEAVFADFGVVLPPLTLAVIDGARWLRTGSGASPPGWMLSAPVALLALSALAVWAVLHARGSVSPMSTSLLTTLLMVVVVLVVGVLVVALGAPLVSLGTSLGA